MSWWWSQLAHNVVLLTRDVFREDWISAIQSVAERLQVLDESDLSPSAMRELDSEAAAPFRSKKRRVVSTDRNDSRGEGVLTHEETQL